MRNWLIAAGAAVSATVFTFLLVVTNSGTTPSAQYTPTSRPVPTAAQTVAVPTPSQTCSSQDERPLNRVVCILANNTLH
ncbi:MAG TPA: hypothetical protein VFT64_06755 [Rickettsiales bacterium]|nr:hypothetical protein [Rickettsiales bacterium]